jgi:signal transduction histidine kinase
MKEVSCKAMEIFFRPLAAKGIPASRLVEGTSVSLDTLQDKHERLDWNDFLIVMRNVRRLFTDEELFEAGRMHLRSPMTRFVSVVAKMLFSPMEFYQWIFSPKRGVGGQMFTCIVPSYEQRSATELDVSLTLLEDYEPCWEFFVVTQGNLTEMPRLLGYPEAKVTLERIPRGGRFSIVMTGGASLRTRVVRALIWPFTARVAARELKEAHETLQERYEQLEEARSTLDRQARQLRTAHAVSTLVNQNLDLEMMLDAVTRALIDQAAFVAVDVELSTVVDGVRVERRVRRGDDRTGFALVRALEARGGSRLGEIRVHPKPGAETKEREELLSFIVPTLGMALDNAVSYEVLADYRRSLEKRVDERTAELSAARDELAAVVIRLREAKEARDKIFADVNHEIRTPLSMIILAVGEARAAQNGHGNPKTMRTLETIEHGARRLLRMVDEMLLLAEGREAELKLHLETTDLTAIVQGIAHAWMPAARAKGISLVTEVAGDCTVRADVFAMERVLSNLVSNAVKFTKEGGRIVLRLAERESRVVLDVADDGVGIDDELRLRLFGRFERARSSKTNGVGGSGIGLSLVKDLVEGHGGTITVDSTVGEGARFRIDLPACAQASPATAPAPPSLKLRPQDFGVMGAPEGARDVYEPVGTPHATILLAEDDPVLRDSIGRALSPEYRVFAAPDGEEALRIAAKHPPDLLVTDVSMPKMDGLELTRRFLVSPANRLAPVLVLTAFGEIRDRLAGFEAGAIDYIIKPFEPAELRARVRSQLALRALAMQLMDAEKLAALGTLAAGLAHEMRNPANGIVNAIAPLREVLPAEATAPGTQAAELLDVIESCSEQIGFLSRQLLGFQRGLSADRKAIPVDALISRVKRTVQPLLVGREFREKLEYRGTLSCAEPLISQVLANLFDNAAHAAGEGGWIEVRSSVENQNVVLEVADSGPGVPPDLRARIFDPFFTTKPAGQGTGLGLATAREIVTRHGGTLDVREGAGKTVFRIEIPLETSG